MIKSFKDFEHISEGRHLDPMKSERISSRSGRRSYLENQLARLGYNYVLDITPEQEEAIEDAANGSGLPDPIMPDKDPGEKTEDPMTLEDLLKSLEDYDSPEFIQFCEHYYEKKPSDMDPRYREWAMRDYLMDKEFDLIYSGGRQDTRFAFAFKKRVNRKMEDNIVVFANGYDPDKPTRVLMAHYDVNTESDAHDNANDNGAAIIVMLEYLEDKNFPSSHNILVVFTDGEEFGGQGSTKFADQIKKGLYGEVEWVLNLDVVGIGDMVAFEDETSVKLRPHIESKLGDSTAFIGMPFNDAMKLRKYGVDSLCLTVIPSEYWDPEKRRLTKSPPYWSNLHGKKDSWDTIDPTSIELAYKTCVLLMNS